MKTTTDKTKKEVTDKSQKQKTRLSQSSCPLHSLEDAIKIPVAIKENFAGQPTDPLLLASACNYSPSSSTWRTLTGAAMAYGLTNGGYNSKEIALTSLGERIVAPIIEGDVDIAIREAALNPTILNFFFNQYNRNKFPREDIAKNVLQKQGIPHERLDSTYEIIRKNGSYTGMIQLISGAEYIRMENCIRPEHEEKNIEEQDHVPLGNDELPPELMEKMAISAPMTDVSDKPIKNSIPRVFISHGKNKTIVGQLKELLSYGQLEPVVSVERETTAIPVPDKVFDDMRNSDAGIIHVDTEEFQTENDFKYTKINENILIEIGAAIALYGKKVVLLCRTGVKLPSNLQGLYRCEYDGDQLDYKATMKLLKTMQELRNMM